MFLFSLLRHQEKKKMTVITNTHCWQKVLIAALWDDVNPVFDHRPWAIFQILRRSKKTKQKTDWCRGQREKKGFCRSLITDYHNPMNKHLSCQLPHYEAGTRECGAIWNLVPCHIFMSSTNFFPSDGPSNVRKAAQRASWGPLGLKLAHFFNAPSGLRKKPTEKGLCVSSPACHKMPKDWFERGEGRADAAASKTLVPFGLALTKLLLQNFILKIEYTDKFTERWLKGDRLTRAEHLMH